MRAILSSDALSKLRVIAAGVAVSGALLLPTGCGGNKATAAHSPPPQTLSEPVQRQESAPAASTGDYDYTAQRVGESRELPQASAPAAVVQSAPAAPTLTGGGKYHTLAKGETIYALSRMYGVKPKQILDANKFKDPNHLAVGTKVYIP